MQKELLNLLECPFCAGKLRVENGSTLEQSDAEILHGILLCDCCAFPIVGGIPYLRTGREADAALRCLGEKKHAQALDVLLGKPGGSERLASSALSFQEALAIVNDTPEGVYLLYRFSDPTFIANETMLCALAGQTRDGRILDVCGGTGHLTRSMIRSSGSRAVLADLEFWKLYLAQRFIVPDADIVCCNANEPLPFRAAHFSLTVCADAFHYIWSKRQFASELQRVTTDAGVVALPHVHNALSWNPSQGMPLSPSGYARLFADREVLMFDDAQFLAAALKGETVDFLPKAESAELESAPALAILAMTRPDSLRAQPLRTEAEPQALSLNPLYHQDPSARSRWRRVFPSADYEDEYGACKEYLPDTVELEVNPRRRVNGLPVDQIIDLARRRVLLDLPPKYLLPNS